MSLQSFQTLARLFDLKYVVIDDHIYCGNMDFNRCDMLTALPDHMMIDELDLDFSAVNNLKNLRVRSLSMRHTIIDELPDTVQIVNNGTLAADACRLKKIAKLPKEMSMLLLPESVTELPEGLETVRVLKIVAPIKLPKSLKTITLLDLRCDTVSPYIFNQVDIKTIVIDKTPHTFEQWVEIFEKQ